MKSLVEFIYNGEVNIYQDNLVELLRIANILKIKGLDEMPPQSATTEPTCADDNDDAESESLQNNTLTVDHNAPLPSTSDRTPVAAVLKAGKKRKSVSFSDKPEIVCDKQRSNDGDPSTVCEQQSDSVSGNGKRKLRSLSDVCSIIKIEKPQTEDAEVEQPNVDNRLEQAHKNQQLVVTINPHAIYSSSESINIDSQVIDSHAVSALSSSASPKKQQQQQQRSSNVSRKMIRKNENFLRALEAVRDEGIGFCKAAKLYGVNNRTLWYANFQNVNIPSKTSQPS